jgi:hypothetical protein
MAPEGWTAPWPAVIAALFDAKYECAPTPLTFWPAVHVHEESDTMSKSSAHLFVLGFKWTDLMAAKNEGLAELGELEIASAFP